VALGVAEQLSPSALGHAISGPFRGDELMCHALAVDRRPSISHVRSDGKEWQ
jgi:hypothetical protein